FLVQELAAALAEGGDDPLALVEVDPEPAGVEEFELGLAVAEHLAKPRVVKQQPPVLVDDHQPRRAVVEGGTELPLVLGHVRFVPRQRLVEILPAPAYISGHRGLTPRSGREQVYHSFDPSVSAQQ